MADCPRCGASGERGNYCGNCGGALPTIYRDAHQQIGAQRLPVDESVFVPDPADNPTVIRAAEEVPPPPPPATPPTAPVAQQFATPPTGPLPGLATGSYPPAGYPSGVYQPGPAQPPQRPKWPLLVGIGVAAAALVAGVAVIGVQFLGSGAAEPNVASSGAQASQQPAATGPASPAATPSGLPACPAGTQQLSQSTWPGGWLVVCGSAIASPSWLAFSDSELGAGETSQVVYAPGMYCASSGASRACAYAAPALVAFVVDGEVVQRSVESNFFADSGSGGAGQGTGPTGVEAPDNTAKDQVRYLTEILAKSAKARGKLSPAINNVVACKKVSASIKDMQAVSDNRTELLKALESTPVDRIDGGEELLAQLRAALLASLATDDAYVAWAQDEQANGCANGRKSSLYKEAQKLDKAVDPLKAAFISNWNQTIVPVYGVKELANADV
ncbi:MAG: hypothetical protein LBR58_04625 [Propionibacteriaceae bacterium]|jgi:hypothetical protein|nr:hypothetical protein [Propionibacteriaceae bacterium]